MSSRVRVVFFHIGSETFGGGSKMLLRLLQSIDKEKFEPLLLSNANDELCQKADDHGIEVKVVPFYGALDTYNRGLLSELHLLPFAGLRTLQFNVNVRQYLSEADIIWCKNLRAVLTLLPHIVATRTPTIWNIGLGLESSGKITHLNSLALRAVDHVFIESEKQAKRIFTTAQYNSHAAKFTVFHKGIDTSKFDPQSVKSSNESDTFTIGTAASLTPRKGIAYLIDALPMILEEREDVRLRIAGTAPDGHEDYENQLREMVDQYGIGSHVEFLGWVEDMPAYLYSLDVFVLPSLNEGIPGAVREALAMEVPVIATDVGGTSDVVIDVETGYLIPPDDAQEIADRVLRLYTKSHMRNAGTRGRELIQNQFSVEKYVENYEMFLSEIA